MRSTALVATIALAVSPLAAGCAFEEAPDEASLEIPLVQPGPDGALYRLRGSFEVERPDASRFTVDANVDAPTLTLTLNPGIHWVRLEDGWTLQRSTDGGMSYAAVSATLGSGNPAGVRVVPNRAVSVGFQFFVRETTGTLSIRFGVSPAPRQLSGGIAFTEGTGAFAAYVDRRVDIQIYFDDALQTVTTEADGSRARVYETGLNALEIYNDPVGELATLASGFAGGYLQHTIRIKPDGTHQFEGRYDGSSGLALTFSPSTSGLVTVDESGFPADAFFYGSGSTVELVGGDGTLTGFLVSIRHFQ